MMDGYLEDWKPTAVLYLKPYNVIIVCGESFHIHAYYTYNSCLLFKHPVPCIKHFANAKCVLVPVYQAMFSMFKYGWQSLHFYNCKNIEQMTDESVPYALLPFFPHCNI